MSVQTKVVPNSPIIGFESEDLESLFPRSIMYGYVSRLPSKKGRYWFKPAQEDFGFFTSSGDLLGSAQTKEELVLEFVTEKGWTLLTLH